MQGNQELQEAMRYAKVCRTFGARTMEQRWLAELHREVERLRELHDKHCGLEACPDLEERAALKSTGDT